MSLRNVFGTLGRFLVPIIASAASEAIQQGLRSLSNRYGPQTEKPNADVPVSSSTVTTKRTRRPKAASSSDPISGVSSGPEISSPLFDLPLGQQP